MTMGKNVKSPNQKAAKQPSEVQEKIRTATAVIIEYLGNREIEAAEAYLDSLVKQCKQVSCKALHHSLIHACANANNAGAALWCAVRMLHIGLKPNTVTFNTLLDSAAKAGDTKLAASLWDLMMQLGVAPNGVTYNTMMNSCVRGGDMKRAEWWLTKMQADKIQLCAVSFNTVIAALAKIGDYEMTEKWFARMVHANVKPDVVIYNSMISARAKAGHAQQAEYWMLEMQRSGLSPDERAYNIIVCAFAKSGNPERAECWLREMESRGFSPDKISMVSLVLAWAKLGDAKRSEHWVSSMAAHGYVPNFPRNKGIVQQACQRQGRGRNAKMEKWEVPAQHADYAPSPTARTPPTCDSPLIMPAQAVPQIQVSMNNPLRMPIQNGVTGPCIPKLPVSAPPGLEEVLPCKLLQEKLACQRSYMQEKLAFERSYMLPPPHVPLPCRPASPMQRLVDANDTFGEFFSL